MLKKFLALLGLDNKTPEDFGDHTVLIVDDNQTDRELVKRTVEKMGLRALTAENGRIGYEIAKKEKPDLILSDCNMPEQDGVGMAKQIKADPSTRDIPFVFLTSVDAPKIVVECFDMGVDNYICKPINPKLLTGQIASILKEHFSPKE